MQKASQTLSIKKPAVKPEGKLRPEQALIGHTFDVQTKTATRIKGTLTKFANGWVEIQGTEYRWVDGLLSAPITSGTFTIDRQNIAFFVEVL